MQTIRMHRRQAVGRVLATGGAAASLTLPAFLRANSRRRISHRLQSGDIGRDGAVIWARADRPSLVSVEGATRESFRDARRLPPLSADDGTDKMAKMLVTGMPSDAQVSSTASPWPT